MTVDAFLLSTIAVAIAEIGDKTQLLSLVLAARYRRPWAICLGILAATLANHALAGAFGMLVAQWLSPTALTWIVGLSFLAVAAWTLVPDKLSEDDAPPMSGRGVFVATLIAFFIAEMGDKTQVATVVLGAQHSPLWAVIAGTTVGMMIANVPVVFLGHALADRLPLRAARIAAAVLFAAMGLWILLR